MANTIWSDALNAMGRLFPNVSDDDVEYQYYDALDRISVTLVEYRMKHNLSQSALAKALDVSQAMISKYESGEYNISLKAAYELFDKLGMRFDCTISAKPAYQDSLSTSDNYSNDSDLEEKPSGSDNFNLQIA